MADTDMKTDEAIVNRTALTSIIGDLARQAISLVAADALAGRLNGDDRAMGRCPVCGAMHGEPHRDTCQLAAYTATRTQEGEKT